MPAFALLLPLALLAAGSPLPVAVPDPQLAAFEQASAELRRRHADPAAIAPLLRLRELEPILPDLGKAAAVYRSVADDPRAHAEVRSLARWYLAGVEESRGNRDRAREERRRLGFLQGWWIAGPFDNEGRAGFARAFPPETSIDLEARFPGKVREVGWRALPPELEWSGIANLGTAVRPQHEAVVYALAVPEVAREQRARLWIGASGAVRVWVNGVKVLEDAAYHPARLDQAAVEVTLRRGPNRILVKLAQDRGEMAIAVRLTDLRGAPVGVVPARMPPLPPLQAGPAPRPVPVPSLVSALSARAAKAKGAAEGRARMDLAAALGEKLSEDMAEHAAVTRGAPGGGAPAGRRGSPAAGRAAGGPGPEPAPGIPRGRAPRRAGEPGGPPGARRGGAASGEGARGGPKAWVRSSRPGRPGLPRGPRWRRPGSRSGTSRAGRWSSCGSPRSSPPSPAPSSSLPGPQGSSTGPRRPWPGTGSCSRSGPTTPRRGRRWCRCTCGAASSTRPSPCSTTPLAFPPAIPSSACGAPTCSPPTDAPRRPRPTTWRRRGCRPTRRRCTSGAAGSSCATGGAARPCPSSSSRSTSGRRAPS